MPDPNVLVARAATPLPVEVVVRGYITGVTSTSLWQQYADGARDDLRLPLPRRAAQEHTRCPTRIVTPTTKGDADGRRTTSRSPCAEVRRARPGRARAGARCVEAALLLFAAAASRRPPRPG